MPHANEAIGKSHMRVWCARKEATRLFATTIRAESESAVNVTMCRRGVWIVVVCHVDGKDGFCGQRVIVASGFCVCTGAHEQPTNNWQSVGQMAGFTTSVAVAQAVSSSQSQSRDGAQLN